MKKAGRIIEMKQREEGLRSILTFFAQNNHIYFNLTATEMWFQKEPVRLTAKEFEGLRLDMILHEMAHFVECDEEKLGLKNFGLPWTSSKHHKTDAAVQRELRVLALQLNACRRLKIPFDMDYEAENLQNVPGWSVHVAGQTEHWDTYKKMILIPNIRRIARQKRHQFDHFTTEWQRRVALLESEPERIR